MDHEEWSPENYSKEDYEFWACKDKWDNITFLCLVADINLQEIKVTYHDDWTEIEFKDPELEHFKNHLHTIETWHPAFDQHPFWYINKTILEMGPNIIPQELLKSVINKFNKHSKNDPNLTKTYPNLSALASEKIVSIESKLFLFKNQTHEIPLDNLPPEIQIAIDVWFEHWFQLPKKMRHPLKNNILNYLTEKHGIQRDKANRICIISRPKDAPKGPANSKHKTFEIFSKRK